MNIEELQREVDRLFDLRVEAKRNRKKGNYDVAIQITKQIISDVKKLPKNDYNVFLIETVSKYLLYDIETEKIYDDIMDGIRKHRKEELYELEQDIKRVIPPFKTLLDFDKKRNKTKSVIAHKNKIAVLYHNL